MLFFITHQNTVLGEPARCGGSPGVHFPAVQRRESVRPVVATGEPEGLNQIEIWFSILMRKLLKRSSFLSPGDLAAKILDFIAYYNDKMAKPFKWTYKGKALTA